MALSKLQASMKDRSAKSWLERRMYYKIGSCFAGCRNCGDVVWDESGRKRFVSGYEVFRAYRPWQTGFTWICMSCGAKDLACWSDTHGELGKEPRVGCRSALAEIRKERREAADPKPRLVKSVRIYELEQEVERLRMILKEKN
jgi:hypothetical protein